MLLSWQVSYLAADRFFPEWNVWIQFLEESTTGFRLDALAGSHPIEVTIIMSSLSARYDMTLLGICTHVGHGRYVSFIFLNVMFT